MTCSTSGSRSSRRQHERHDTYAKERYGVTQAFNVNDSNGYEAVMKMLDDYIVEVEEGRAREPEVEATT